MRERPAAAGVRPRGARPARLALARPDRLVARRRGLAPRRHFAARRSEPSPISRQRCRRPCAATSSSRSASPRSIRRPTQASGTVFLRVLHDALDAGAGAADLLLPRRGLGEVFPAPALAWLEQAGATIRLAHRVERLERRDDGWLVDARAGRPRRRRRERGRGDPPGRTARERLGELCGAPAPRADRHRLRAQRRLLAARADARPVVRCRPAGAIRVRPRPARRRSGAARLRHQRRVGLGRARRGRDRAGDAGAGARGARAPSARPARGRAHDDREAGDLRLHAAAHAPAA